jgi:RNA polymerase sigma-70 factor (ECF subfamily)
MRVRQRPISVPRQRDQAAMTPDELARIERLRRGERAAIEQLVRTHHGFLLGMVIPLVGAELAQDVVQETWVKALRAMGDFEGRASLRTWLAQIALNTARSRRRTQCREKGSSEWGHDPGSPLAERFGQDGHWNDPPAAWHYSTPEALLTEAELRGCIDKHLQLLPPDQQTIVRLRELEGLELLEIAAITELSEGNVRVLLHRARQKLHAMIDNFHRVGTC